MFQFIHQKNSLTRQYLFSVSLVLLVSGLCFSITDFVGYRVVALILLATVSFLAMFFRIFPVLLAALLSALIWDFLFIPPRFTFQVTEAEDALMLLMYFLIAMVNAVLMNKVRRMEKQVREDEKKANTLRLYNTVLSSLSHELRTPISTIIGASDNLLQEKNKLTEADQKNLLTEISIASVRLNRQVENLLNVSRLESGIIQPKTDWCDLSELMHAVVNNLEEFSSKHTVRVLPAENLPFVKLDFGLMEQVLGNLVHNALLYTPAGSTIEISASCKDDVCTIRVADNGPGFPAEETEKVFEKFYRLKNASAGGTGLGLSIVRGFVEAHHGNVRIEHASPQGAIFNIEIPVETNYLNNLKHE